MPHHHSQNPRPTRGDDQPSSLGNISQALRPGMRVTDYPEAHTSSIDRKFSGPVMGTVIIGRDLPDGTTDDDVFELVAPDGTVLNPSHATARAMLKQIEASLNQKATIPSFPSRANGSGPAAGRAALSSPSTAAPPPVEPSETRLLKEGGYVVFSDLYFEAHPCSPITNIAHDYGRVCPRTEETPFTVDPSLKPDKQRVEKIKHLLREADAYHRPLFRRRPSRLRYGSAAYISSADVVQEMHFDPVPDFSELTLSCNVAPDGSLPLADGVAPNCSSDAQADAFLEPRVPSRKPSKITIAVSVAPGTLCH